MYRSAWLRLSTVGPFALVLTACGGGGQSQNTSPGPGPGPGPTTLQLSVSATTGGMVTSTPAGINCGQTCSASFNDGTSVTLTATANAGDSFTGWSGACSGSSNKCTLVLNQTTSVAATFGSAGVALSVSASGSGSGTIVSNPPGINCASCSASFASGTAVTLTADPVSGSNFGGWSGACSGTGSCAITLSSAASVTASFTATLQSVNHVIFMAQENRGFLHYFGALPKYWADSNGQYEVLPFKGLPQFDPSSPGQPPSIPGCDPSFPPPADCHYDAAVKVQSYHDPNKCSENLSPYWSSSHHDLNFHDPVSDVPALDGFVVVAGQGARALGFQDVNGNRTMAYYTGDDLNYYYFMASNFATSDEWFSPAMTNTAANRWYLLSATSLGHVGPVPNGTPLFTNKTIFEALQDAGISWKVYVTDPNTNLIQSSAMARYTFSYKFPQNFVPASEFVDDAANNKLPQVAMIDPGYSIGTDEHPFDVPLHPGGDVQKGAEYVSSLINGLMNSPSWNDSIFILTWDEFGGFYDNVPPQPAVSPDGIKPLDLLPGDVCTTSTGPTCDFVFTGYRIPLIVVSPFTKRHYVSHSVADSTAILKLIETRFGLANLTERDKNQMDMSEFFDFANAPWSTPPSPPPQALTGPCDELP